MRWLVWGLALLGASPLASVAAQRQTTQAPASTSPPPGAVYSGQAFRFDSIAPGVWFATGTGVVSAESNHAIVDLGDALLVVDAGTSPAAAWALLHELPRVSRKPVRYLVVTHMHYDHAHGTQSFPAGIQIIGTAYTRAMIAEGKSVTHPTAEGNRTFSATQIRTLTAALDTASTAAGRAALTAQRRVWEQYLLSLKTLTPIPPNVTVTDRMTIFRGGREVQILFPGKAHTDGDLVVWLPKERVLVTGDLLQPNLPYMGDGYLDQWADVLDSLEAKRPVVVLPGHGAAFRDMAILRQQRDYFRSAWRQLTAAKARGLSPEQAAATLDLSAFDAVYPRPASWTDAIVVRQRMRMVNRVYTLLGDSTSKADAPRVDRLLLGGQLLDGAGGDWIRADVGITGDRISFVGHARSSGVIARDTVDVRGLLITPGLWDAHNHEKLERNPGRLAIPFLTQGVTTVIVGIDGFGTNDLAAQFATWKRNGIAVNAAAFVGHGPARTDAMGTQFAREATPAEITRMQAYVRKGMEEGALGFSTGLAYNPGYYSTTEEVLALNRVAAEFGGIYDTHDRDMGVSYKGVGLINSVKEAIRIAEEGGTPLIFSHFNSLGLKAHGQMPEAIKMIEAARARGVNIMGAGIVYTASESSVDGHLMPRWVPAGGPDSLFARLRDDKTWARMEPEILEILTNRGGPEKIVITEGPTAWTRRTLADMAAEWKVTPTAALRRMLLTARTGRLMDMNMDIYSAENMRLLAKKDWMMTTVDGYTPDTDSTYTHPRTYGGFTKKITQLVFEEGLLTLPKAIQSMTSLPASFYGIPDRGLVKPGFYADLAVFDLTTLRANATYDNPRQYSDGTVHVFVNGQYAVKNRVVTGTLAGQPIRRGGR